MQEKRGPKVPSEQSDESLMQEYGQGSAAAFQELYRRHSGRVYGYLRAAIRDQAMVDDIFQLTFLKIHRTRARYDARYPFTSWLFTITRTVMLDSLRKKKRTRELPDSEAIDIAPDPVSIDDQGGEAAGGSNLAAIQGLMDGLPPAQQQALALRYSQSLEFDEIARRLNTSSANARQLVSRGVRAIKGLLEPETKKGANGG